MDSSSVMFRNSKVLNPELISRLTGIDLKYAELLIRGVDKAELQQVIAADLGVADPSSSEVEVARMNIAALVRSAGYELQGGRKGRNLPYKILSYNPPKVKPTVDQWDGHPRLTYDWVHQLENLTASSYDWVTEGLLESHRSDLHWHEHCFLYPYTYELAKHDRGFLYDPGEEGKAIIVQRFTNYPRFKIINLSILDPVILLQLAEYVAQASTKRVKIVNVFPDQVKELKRLDSKGWIEKRTQAVYRCEEIANNPRKFMSLSECSAVRKHFRDLQFDEVQPGGMYVEQQTRLVDIWRGVNEPKQRQLAITRDYEAIKASSPSTIVTMGWRDGDPVCLRIFDRHPLSPEWVSELVEKALNYRTMPGGRSGTTNFSLVASCQLLLEKGIKYINGGGYEGGGEGLPVHKSRFARPEDDVTSLTFATSFTTAEELLSG